MICRNRPSQSSTWPFGSTPALKALAMSRCSSPRRGWDYTGSVQLWSASSAPVSSPPKAPEGSVSPSLPPDHYQPTHSTLFADLAWLDPRKFDQIRTTALPSNAFQNQSKCLLKFDSGATVNNLQSELKCFAGQWERLKASHVDEYKTRIVEDGSAEQEEETDIVNKTSASCKNFPLCCYQVLRRFNLLSDAYHLLGLAYKYLPTLSLTQVACERSFSTLKFIKSRLRSSLSPNKLEMFMLMATEKDILMSLDSDMLIVRVAEKSELLRKLLL